MTATAVNAASYHHGVGRWEPNARERLEQAAMELYAERGFDSTTVAEIAERAGLTERTFFRYFSDKREVLFYGARYLVELLVGAVDRAPEALAPVDVVVAALLEAASTIFVEERRPFATRRQVVILANRELEERELAKMAMLGTQLAAALRRRGIPDLAASLAAEVGIAIFRVSFQRWVDDAGGLTFAHFIEQAREELTATVLG